VSRVVGLLARSSLIGLMVFTFARVIAAIGMKLEDYFIQGRRGWVRLRENHPKSVEASTLSLSAWSAISLMVAAASGIPSVA
jgi:hypothetical protein